MGFPITNSSNSSVKCYATSAKVAEGYDRYNVHLRNKHLSVYIHVEALILSAPIKQFI